MNRQTLRLLGVAIALATLLLAGATAAFGASGPTGTFFSRMMGGSGYGGMMGGANHGSMMNGNHHGTMMNGSGPGGMMGGSSPGSMMGGWSNAGASGTTISLDQARQNVQRYIDRTGNKRLTIDEVMEFQRNFYAVITDTSTGHGAMEVLVNKSTGAVFLEFGPAMMWNTQYGMMTGRMGQMMGYEQPRGPITVSTDQAATIARQWLEKNKPGATAEAADQFPGYYTVHFSQGGKFAGMLSVNGYTGQVWYHIWHGAFVH